MGLPDRRGRTLAGLLLPAGICASGDCPRVSFGVCDCACVCVCECTQACVKPVSVPLWGTRLWAFPGAPVCLYLSVLCPRLLPVSLAEKGDGMGTLRSGGGGGSGWLSIPAGPGGRLPCPDVLQSPCGMCASRHRLRAFCPGKGGGGVEGDAGSWRQAGRGGN